MSGTTPPPRRRRIAGESAQPAASNQAPAGKPVAKKPATNKQAAQKKAGQQPQQAAVPASNSTPTSADKPSVRTPSVRTAARPTVPGGMRDVVALVVAALLLAGGITTAVLGFKNWQGDSFTDSRVAAAKSAGDAIETILSYQYDKLDAHSQAVKSVMTPSYYRDEYLKTTAPALEKLAPQRKVKVDAVVRNVATIPCGEKCSPTKAQVLMFVDLDRRIEGEDAATVFGNRIRVDMQKVDGDWRVANVTGL